MIPKEASFRMRGIWKGYHRVLSLLLAALLALSPLSGLAEMMGGNLFSLSLQWTDSQGTIQGVMANPVS